MKDLTAKDKAKELVNQFQDSITGLEGYEWWDSAKQCAIIAVDEIINCTKNGLGLTKFSKEYWQEVKKEIEKQ